MTSPLPVLNTLDELTRRTRLLRRLNNGRGPAKVLMCVYCLRVADIREDEHAWDGWTITPYDECPECIEAGLQPGETPVHLEAAREMFQEALRKVMTEKCSRSSS